MLHDVGEGAKLLVQARLHDLRAVVVALDQGRPVDVADTRDARRVRRLVVGVTGRAAQPTPAETPR